MHQLVVRVLPDLAGLEKTFDYVVPDRFRDHVRVGTMVRVDLHGRRVGAWVVAVGVEPEPGVAERLKPIAKVSGWGPSAEFLDLATWIAWRWAGTERAVLTVASPDRVVASVPPARWTAPRPRRPHAQAIEVLQAGGGTLVTPPSSDPLSVIAAATTFGPTLVVVPSVAEAGVLAARLRAAHVSTALWPREWSGARGGVDVVIGARSAALASLPESDGALRSIVLLDEHDEALQEERNPTWHARDVLAERATRRGVPLLLVSPSPTLAALDTGKVVHPPVQALRDGWPIVEVVDRSAEAPWKTSVVSSRLVTALRDPSARVVCVINTVGRSGRLACSTCRSLLACERCEALVVQDRDGQLACRRCDTTRPVICQACSSLLVKSLRPGVSRLREELEAAAGRPVTEVTASTTEIGSEPILVGTEAVLHRAGHADVVAFLDLDTELLAPRIRASEQAMTLLVRGARLLGPRARGGRLLIQTRLPDHPVVRAALLADSGQAAAADAEHREDLRFPPFGALAELSGPGALELAARLRTVDGVIVGPAPNGNVLARAATWEELATALDLVDRPAERVRVAVDPPRA